MPFEPDTKPTQGFTPDAEAGMVPDTGFVADEDEDRIGFGEAFTEDVVGKLPFSPTRVADMAGTIQSSMRLSRDDAEEYEQQIWVDAQAQALTGRKDPRSLEAQVVDLRNQDIQRVEEYLIDQEEKSRRGYSTMGRVGQITSEMPSFVIEFLATGGLKKLGQEAAKTAGAKVLRKYAATTAGKAAIAAGGLAAGTALRSAGMPHRAAEAILKRQTPRDMEIDDEGNVTIEGPVEGVATSVWKGLADHYIEVLSEEAGELIGPVATGGFNKLPFMGKLITKLESKWLGAQAGRTAAGFAKKISTATGFHGVLSEVGEEFLGDQLRAITDVDDFGAGEDASTEERVVAAFNQDVENLPAMIISFAVPGVARFGAGKVIDRQIAKNQALQEELDFVNSLDPTEYYEAGLAEHYSKGLKKGFEEPGIMKYITPKWLLNRQMGVENTLEEINNAHMAFELEQKDLKSWINKTITKLKKEKDLTRLPDLLPEEAVKEAAWSGEKGEIFAMGESAPSNVFRNTKTGKIVFEEADVTFGGESAIGMRPSTTEKGGTEYFEKATGGLVEVDLELSAFAMDVQKGQAEPDVTKTKAHILQNKLDGSDSPVHIMRDLLDTYESAPAFLSKSESNIFNAIRTLTRSMRRRANEARATQGLEEIGDVEGYITHWRDRTVDKIMDGTLVTDDPTLKGLMANPTSRERTLEDVNSYFSKDLGRLLNQMVAFDLRDIHLSGPQAAVLEELSTLLKKKMIPKKVAKEVRDYLRYDISRATTPIDKAFDKTTAKASTFIAKLTKGRVALNLTGQRLLTPFRRLGFMSGLGFRLKAPLRNLGQRMLLFDLYSTESIMKAQMAQMGRAPVILHPVTGEPINLMDYMKDQPWYRLTVRKFEDTVTDAPTTVRTATGEVVQKVQKVGLAAYSASHKNNVHVSAMTGFFEWQKMYEMSRDKDSDHYKRCEREAIRRKVPLDTLLTQEEDMDWQMREAVRRSQWEYFATSMPSMIRGQVARAGFQFQTWWMNYYANHCRAMITQTATGLNDKGRLLPKGGRTRSLKGLGTLYAMGKVAESVLGIAVLKFLITPVPGQAPIPQFLWSVMAYMFSDDERDRKKAVKNIKQTMKFWVPYSLALKDAHGLLTGEMDLTDWFFYKQPERKY